jgi:hypothetical protein
MSGVQPVANGTLAGLIGLLFGLLMFGVVYAVFVYWLDERKRGYTSLLVVAGVSITMIGIALMDALTDWPAVVITGVCFICSGTPMIVGEIVKTIRQRQAEITRQLEHAHQTAEQAINEARDDQA